MAGYAVATVTRDYNQQQQYPVATLPYKKPGTGFTETSSILKKHREEINELSKPPPTVFSIETSAHRQPDSRSSTKSISIINQPLPEIPKQASNNPQVLSAANLTNYRSLQRPQTTKSSYPSGTTQRRDREREPRPVVPMKTSAPPILPPKNRQQSRNLSMPGGQKSSGQSYNQYQQQHQQQQYPSRNHDRERERERPRERERDRDKSIGRSYDDTHQYRSSSKQQQLQLQQQNFQTLPHHHHHPAPSFTTQGTNTKSNRKSDSSKSLHRSSREMSHPRFENYSATEL